MRREVCNEMYMSFAGQSSDALLFDLARAHQGDHYYEGASGAPIAEADGRIVAVLVGASRENPNQVRAADLASFVAAMQVKSPPNEVVWPWPLT